MRPLGILVLDTAFPRIVGDGGNPESYPFPVIRHVVAGADVMRVVRGKPLDPALLADFIAGAQALEAQGVCGIVSSCGFLASAQRALSAAVRVPVVASALSLGPLVQVMTGGRPLGILTADAGSLTPDLLRACGLDPAMVRVAGMEGAAAWRRLILAPKAEQAREIDPEEIGGLAEGLARKLVAETPEIGAILLECTNLPPYTARLQAATGLPVFSILDAARLIYPMPT